MTFDLLVGIDRLILSKLNGMNYTKSERRDWNKYFFDITISKNTVVTTKITWK